MPEKTTGTPGKSSAMPGKSTEMQVKLSGISGEILRNDR